MNLRIRHVFFFQNRNCFLKRKFIFKESVCKDKTDAIAMIKFIGRQHSLLISAVDKINAFYAFQVECLHWYIVEQINSLPPPIKLDLMLYCAFICLHRFDDLHFLPVHDSSRWFSEENIIGIFRKLDIHYNTIIDGHLHSKSDDQRGNELTVFHKKLKIMLENCSIGKMYATNTTRYNQSLRWYRCRCIGKQLN